MTIFDEKIEIGERCKGVHCVDLGESFPTRIYYLLAKIGVDTAENEPLEVRGENSIQQSFASLVAKPFSLKGRAGSVIRDSSFIWQ